VQDGDASLLITGAFAHHDCLERTTKEERDAHFHQQHLAAIQNAVAKLVEEGLLERCGERNGRPVHRITTAGLLLEGETLDDLLTELEREEAG